MDLITYSHQLVVLVGCADKTAILRVRDNEEAYNRYKIRARVMKDVSNIDMSTTIWGRNVSQFIKSRRKVLRNHLHRSVFHSASRRQLSTNWLTQTVRLGRLVQQQH